MSAGMRLDVRLLKAAAKWTSKEETRYSLTSVWIEGGDHDKLTYIATDGKRLLVLADECETVTPETLPSPLGIPRDVIDRMRVSDDVSLAGRSLTIKDKRDFTMKTTIAKNDRGFPKWREVVPPESKTELYGINSEFLFSALGIANELGQTATLHLPEDGRSPCRIDGRSSAARCGVGKFTAVIMPVSLE